MSSGVVPFHTPYLAGKAELYLQESLLHPLRKCFSTRCEELLQAKTGSLRVLLTNSCTSALELAALLAEVNPGDEVIVPSFTFTSTANAFAARGARIIFVDIRPNDMNMSTDAMEAAISAKTRAIIPVHYAGAGCDMPRIVEIAKKRNIMVVEDAAQCIGSKLGGQPLGTFGALGTYSFHSTKNLGCGEGGALLINDPELIDRALVIRDKGTNREQFKAGVIHQYEWVDIGLSAPPSELQAAYLLAQLEQEEVINQERRRLWDRYYSVLRPLSETRPFRLLTPDSNSQHNAHIVGLVFETKALRDRAKTMLADAGIQSALHYQPLHLSPAGKVFGEARGDMTNSETLPYRLLRLPIWHGLPDDTPDRIAKVLRNE